MAQVTFTGNVQRHVRCPAATVPGDTVGQVLAAYFNRHPRARGYVLDDQGAVRKHIVVIVDGLPLRDRSRLSDPAVDHSQIYVLQALSGG